MVVGALASAFAPNVLLLVIFRFILGIGAGGDYPVSAVLMSEFSNRRSRGRLVALVFSMQALGTICGYIAGLSLLSTGMNEDYVWRIILALGAVPAAVVLYLRRKMPESPRYRARVQGQADLAAADIAAYSEGVIRASADGEQRSRLSLQQFLTDRRYLLWLIGTAGTWIVFAIAAVPGYYLAAHFMDRIGHRLLQMIGFFFMGLAFLLIGVIPNVTTTVAPFLVLFGFSYFFAEFGPNTTTFVLPAEIFPTSARTTGHGIAAGVAKVGAFIGVFLLPVIKTDFGVAGAMRLFAAFSWSGSCSRSYCPSPLERAWTKRQARAMSCWRPSALPGRLPSRPADATCGLTPGPRVSRQHG